MKSFRLILGLSVLIVMVVIVSLVISNEALSQTNLPQNNVAGRGDGIAWKQKRIPISSREDRLNLHLPNLSRDPNWIVGVSPIKSGEKEEIAIGVVDWASLNKKNRPGAMKIAKVFDYESSAINVSFGQIIIKDVNEFRESGQSLVVFIKSSPSTLINIFQQDNFLGSKRTDKGFVVQNNLPIFEGENSVSKLLTQLQTDRLVRGFGARAR